MKTSFTLNFVRKTIISSTTIIFLLILPLLKHNPIYAFQQVGSCSWQFTDRNGNNAPPFIKDYNADADSMVNWTVTLPAKNNEYKIEASCTLWLPCFDRKTATSDPTTGQISGTFKFTSLVTGNPIYLNVHDPLSNVNPVCVYTIDPSDWIAEPTPTPKASAECVLDLVSDLPPSSDLTEQSLITVKGQLINIKGYDPSKVKIWGIPYLVVKGGITKPYTDLDKNLPGGIFEKNIGRWPNGIYTVELDSYADDNQNPHSSIKCSTSFKVCDSGCGILPTPTVAPTNIPGQPTYTPVPPVPSLAPLCQQIADRNSADPKTRELNEKCRTCLDEKHGIWTAVGCLPLNLDKILKDYVFTIGIGLAGGVSFLYFLLGVFLIMTSAGNAEQIAHAKEIIVSAISGLLFIIFSIFLLQVIGVDILRIPGFTR